MRRSFCLILFAAAGCIGLPKHVEPSVPEPMEIAVDSLGLAAGCLDRGDSAGAIPHLAEHVRRNPDESMIRSLLAEQLLKTGDLAKARTEFERTADGYRADPAKHRESLVQCHTRLMQIALEDGNEFRESFHRGAGLLLVFDSWDVKDRDPTLTERTLTQALTNLRVAVEKMPDDARANLLLGDVLTRLGQHAAAHTAYRKAFTAPPGHLTEAERAKLLESLNG